MGSILSAFKEQKPILVMPRLGYLGETRNEHQTATAKKLQEKCRINVAFDEEELSSKLDSLDSQPSSSTFDLAVSERLIGKISALIPA